MAPTPSRRKNAARYAHLALTSWRGGEQPAGAYTKSLVAGEWQCPHIGAGFDLYPELAALSCLPEIGSTITIYANACFPHLVIPLRGLPYCL
jgi:hypothetical protein